MSLAEDLNEWFKTNDVNDLNNEIAKIIRDNLKAKGRWKNAAKVSQGMSKELFFEQAWQDMPEFVQNDLTPVKQLTINFLTYDDVKSLSLLLDQKITSKTKSIWFPKQERIKPSDFVYSTDES